LKLHAAGYLDLGGSLTFRGSYGLYWGSQQNSAANGWNLDISSYNSSMSYSAKAAGFTARCIRDN
jgi:hypothetical protein